jgi:tetratricopeptide (TPR) repeat protein
MNEKPQNSHRQRARLFAIIVGLLALTTALLLMRPGLRMTLAWKFDEAKAYVRGAISPKGGIPAAVQDSNVKEMGGVFLPGGIKEVVDLSGATAAPQERRAVTAQQVLLPPPEFDIKKDIQDWNNCGPATLALALRMFGWKGDQYDIAGVIKPLQTDKNVNPSEMADYVAQTGMGLSALVRVNASAELIMGFLAAGTPVIVEESFKLEQSFWPGDDLWAAHYLLITGYDLNTREWIAQDSYYGPNRRITMDLLEQTWKPFNRLVFVIYKTQDEHMVKGILGSDWDMATNLKQASAKAQKEISANAKDTFAWFNLGNSLLGVKDYKGAVSAFAQARQLGLPQRMLRYQFGPFEAAYETGAIDDLFLLTNYALDRTPNSEEALTWKGWAYVLNKQNASAKASFQRALEAHPKDIAALEGLATLQAR